MKSILQEIRSELRRFIDSRTESLLIVPCEPSDSAPLLKSLEALDDDPESLDIFLNFGHAFAGSSGYVKEIPPIISRQITGVNQELAKRGEPALPPADLMNESQEPPRRLVGLMRYVENLITDERRAIWVLYPIEISEAALYLQLVSYVNEELKTGSLRMTKLIVRDSATSPILTERLGGQPNVRVYRPELDPDSLEKRLSQQANDPNLPEEEQAQLHMILAGFDVAKGRYDTALARNLELLGYFRAAGQRHQQAFVMNNIGDLYYMRKQFKEAQTWYERAINLSINLESGHMALYQSLNLGNALLAQNRFADALVYYGASERLAQASDQPMKQIQALEQMGVANYQMKKFSHAAENWEKAVDLCRELKFEEGQRANLERLRDLYQEIGDSRRLAACKAALSEMKSE